MDQRQTFASPEELNAILKTLYTQQTPAALLADREGLLRISGLIVAINEETPVENAQIVLNNNTSWLLKEIIAVNGIFRSDYSEC